MSLRASLRPTALMIAGLVAGGCGTHKCPPGPQSAQCQPCQAVDDFGCTGGQVCRQYQGGATECVDAPAGATCVDEVFPSDDSYRENCAVGLACIITLTFGGGATGTCEAPLKLGAPCSDHSFPGGGCDAGLNCPAGPNGESHCVAIPRDCAHDSDCPADEVCKDAGVCGSSCAAPLAEGQLCFNDDATDHQCPSFRQTCANGLACLVDGNPGAAGGTCIAPSTVAPCNAASFPNDGCAAGLTCNEAAGFCQ